MEQAISAAKRIRFEPAIENGEPVSVRTHLEFSFDLYPRSLDSHFWQAGLAGVGKPELINVKKPEYTEAARKNRVEGDVRLIVAFGSNGKIGRIDVIEGLPDGLTEKAIETAKAIKFKPATYSDTKKTVNTWSEVAITFKLDQ
jgi:TonB family protein